VPAIQVHQLCDNELSSFYLDVNKDRLYADEAEGVRRRSAQTALWECLTVLTRLLAPILSFTAEEIWQEARKKEPALPESVFLADWPEADQEGLSEDEEKRWDRIIEVRGAVTRVLEQARAGAGLKDSLGTEVELRLSEAYADLADLPEGEWADAAIVSALRLVETPQGLLVIEDEATGCTVAVRVSPHEKCPRCWKREPEVAEKGLCDRCARVMAGQEGK
jgi:isoleucyl-tRNA synthetase